MRPAAACGSAATLSRLTSRRPTLTFTRCKTHLRHPSRISSKVRRSRFGRRVRVRSVSATRSSVFLMVSDVEGARVLSRTGRAARNQIWPAPWTRCRAQQVAPEQGGSSLPVSPPSGSASQPRDTIANSVRQSWRGAKPPIGAGAVTGAVDNVSRLGRRQRSGSWTPTSTVRSASSTMWSSRLWVPGTGP